MFRLFNLIHPKNVYSDEKYEELLDSDWKEEIKAYEEFIESSHQKSKIINEFLAFWDNKPFNQTVIVFNEIKKINLKLIKLLNVLTVDISRDREITQSFLYRLLKDKMGRQIQNLSEDARINYYNQLKYYTARINEDFNTILLLLTKQNEYIKPDNEWKTLQELRQHGQFF